MRRQPRSVASEMEFRHPARRHAQELPPGADVPEPQHAAPAAAGEQLTAGMKRDHQAVVAVSLERANRATRVQVPDSDRVVLEAGRQEIGPARVPGQVEDIRGVVELSEHPAVVGVGLQDVHRAAGDRDDRQPRAIGIVRHRGGAAENRGPPPQLASVRKIDDDDRAIEPGEGEPPAVGVERPVRRVAPRNVGLREDQPARLEIPDLQRVAIVPGLHRQVSAVGTESANSPRDAAWQAG